MRSHPIKYLLTCLLLCGVSPLLSGCGQSEPSADFVFAATSSPNTLDPQQMSWLHDIRIAGCLYEPLVNRQVPEMELEPGAAESWTVSEDGLTYTFTIRPEARWSDGQPVTARDYLYAWRRGLTPDLAADYSKLLFYIEGAEAFFDARQEQLKQYADRPEEEKGEQAAEELWATARDELFPQTVGLEAPDDQTLVVRLEQSTPYFLELCAFATFLPNPPRVIEEHLSFSGDTGRMQIDQTYWSDPDRLVTNGPYRLGDYRIRRDLLLEQNPHYWNAQAMGNTSILQRIIKDPNTALLALENGQIDWYPDLPTTGDTAADLVAAAEAGQRNDVHVTPWAGTYFYSFNTLPEKPDGSPNPLADERVRRALSMAINREQIVNQITKMSQPTARSFVPPDAVPTYEPPADVGVAFNPEKAQQLLSEAGYPKGEGMEGLSILYNTGGGHGPIAEAIQGMWREYLNVSVDLQKQEVQVFGDRLSNQRYTIARASWIGDYRDPSTFLNKYDSRSQNNDSRWENPEYDALLAQAAEMTAGSERMAKLRQAEALLLQGQPIAPIFHYITLDLYDPEKVIGIHPNRWNFRRLEFVRKIDPGDQ
jgi:oligopeptide transport system substrate-binding protein